MKPVTVGVVDVSRTAANDIDRDERRPHNAINTVEQQSRESRENVETFVVEVADRRQLPRRVDSVRYDPSVSAIH